MQLRQETGALEEELEQAVQNRRALLGEQEELSGKIRELTARRTQLEGESTQLRQEERVKNGLKEQVSRTLAGLEEKKATAQREYDALVAKLWDEYEITRSEAAKEYQPLEDSPENQNRLLRLRQEIKGLGNVNLEAIEEYRQVKERYDFLRGQTRDASLAKEELEKLIGDLTRSMVTLFTQGFGQISVILPGFSGNFRGRDGLPAVDRPDPCAGKWH